MAHPAPALDSIDGSQLAELDQLRQEHEATAQVLQAISHSGFDLKPVLQTLIESAGRLCQADTGNISLARDGHFVEVPAWFRPPESAAGQDRLSTISATVQRRRIRVGDRSSLIGRAGGELRTVHIPDTQADAEYRSPFPGAQMIRTALGVPLLGKGRTLIGVIAMNRYQVQPYTRQQVELVERFAGQAVIAIENARLYADSERRRMQADALASLVREGTLQPDPGHVSALVLREACRLLNADYAAVARYEAEGQLTWQGVYGNRFNEWINHPTTGQGALDKAVASGQTVVADRIGDNPD